MTDGDRSKLPLIEATIMEVQRISHVAPGSLRHTSSEDFELDGYHMPKGEDINYFYCILFFFIIPCPKTKQLTNALP